MLSLTRQMPTSLWRVKTVKQCPLKMAQVPAVRSTPRSFQPTRAQFNAFPLSSFHSSTITRDGVFDKPNLSISPDTAMMVVKRLKQLLADEYFLYTRTRISHWLIEGPQFLSYHEMFEKQYRILEEFVDQTAERIRTLGQVPMTSAENMLKANPDIDDTVSKKATALEIVEGLAAQHERMIKFLRMWIDEINDSMDYGTVDMLTDMLKKHEKIAWVLRSHLGR